MIHTVEHLKEKDSVTTGDALLTIAELCRKYGNVLGNIINIRKTNPVPVTELFRKQSSDIENLHKLNAILLKTKKIINEQSRQIILSYEAGLENYDCPKFNQSIVAQLKQALLEMETAYAGKARSFTVILNEFELLTTLLTSKLDQEDIETDYAVSGATMKRATHHDIADSPHDHKTRFAYVRLFHRDMKNLLSPQGSLTWMRPLLDSVKNAEKHGLTIYGDEEFARKSLRNENYGYLTIRLSDEQDLTSQRPERVDPQLNCRLLAIQNITNEDFIKFSFAGYDFPIRKGVLYRPKSIMEEK